MLALFKKLLRIENQEIVEKELDKENEGSLFKDETIYWRKDDVISLKGKDTKGKLIKWDEYGNCKIIFDSIASDNILLLHTTDYNKENSDFYKESDIFMKIMEGFFNDLEKRYKKETIKDNPEVFKRIIRICIGEIYAHFLGQKVIFREYEMFLPYHRIDCNMSFEERQKLAIHDQKENTMEERMDSFTKTVTNI